MFVLQHIKNSIQQVRARRLEREVDHELEMQMNRLYLGIPMLLFCAVIQVKPAIIIAFTVYLGINVLLMIAKRHGSGLTNFRKFAGVILDTGMACYIFSTDGEATAMMYPLYLWSVLGNGFRFGVKWLFISAICSCISFGIVILNTPYWYNQPTLASGLLVGLFLIPAYCSTLITKLSNAKNQAEQANRAKSYFLASISHELRTPLNAIIGYGSHLVEMDLPKKQNQMVGASLSAGKHLLMLINQLLDFAKSESVRQTPKPREFHLTDLLSEVKDILSISAKEKGLAINLQAAPLSDIELLGQPDYIRNMLINLAGNAIKFTAHGTVTLRCGVEQKPSPSIWFSVTDTGPGIPEEAQELIFEAFQQADDSILDKHGGTGLGLAICRQLADQMDGHVDVTSELGKGSTFTFRGPISVADGKTEEISQSHYSVLSFGPTADPAIAGSIAQSDIAITHLVCHTRSEFDEALANISLDDFDVALVDQTLADQIADDAKVWNFFSDAEVAPVLVNESKPEAIGQIKLRAAFASSLPPTADFDLFRSAVKIGCSFQSRDETTASENLRSTPAHSKPQNILVADDNRTNCLLLDTILSDAGHLVTLASDGEETLDLLDQQEFDLLLVDVNMPKINGIETCKIWRQSETPQQHMPIIGITADATLETERRCLDAGMDKRLTKPVDARNLLDVISNISGETTVSGHLPSSHIDPTETVVSLNRGPASLLQAIDQTQFDYLCSIGEPSFIISLFEGYIQETRETMEHFQKTIENSDLEGFRFHAHSFKSAANNVGAFSLSKICAKYEVATAELFDAERTKAAQLIGDEIERVDAFFNDWRTSQSGKFSNAAQSG